MMLADDQRPNPVGPEERARMVQPHDCADLILYIVLLPKRLTMNEVMRSRILRVGEKLR